LIPKGKRDVSGIEEKVLSMYAKGVSDRDISATVDDIYGFRLSAETISKIVDKVSPRLHEWQNRTLDEIYAFMYVDALVVPIKSEGRSINKAVYSILGINKDGKKECIGFWISDKEGTHFWLSIFDELRSRGVKKIGFVSIDGLSRDTIKRHGNEAKKEAKKGGNDEEKKQTTRNQQPKRQEKTKVRYGGI
jgi:transposase-like protein